jgi:hypothetical protein
MVWENEAGISFLLLGSNDDLKIDCDEKKYSAVDQPILSVREHAF